MAHPIDKNCPWDINANLYQCVFLIQILHHFCRQLTQQFQSILWIILNQSVINRINNPFIILGGVISYKMVQENQYLHAGHIFLQSMYEKKECIIRFCFRFHKLMIHNYPFTQMPTLSMCQNLFLFVVNDLQQFSFENEKKTFF